MPSLRSETPENCRILSVSEPLTSNTVSLLERRATRLVELIYYLFLASCRLVLGALGFLDVPSFLRGTLATIDSLYSRFMLRLCNAGPPYGLGDEGWMILAGMWSWKRLEKISHDVSADAFQYASGKPLSMVSSVARSQTRWASIGLPYSQPAPSRDMACPPGALGCNSSPFRHAGSATEITGVVVEGSVECFLNSMRREKAYRYRVVSELTRRDSSCTVTISYVQRRVSGDWEPYHNLEFAISVITSSGGAIWLDRVAVAYGLLTPEDWRYAGLHPYAASRRTLVVVPTMIDLRRTDPVEFPISVRNAPVMGSEFMLGRGYALRRKELIGKSFRLGPTAFRYACRYLYIEEDWSGEKAFTSKSFSRPGGSWENHGVIAVATDHYADLGGLFRAWPSAERLVSGAHGKCFILESQDHQLAGTIFLAWVGAVTFDQEASSIALDSLSRASVPPLLSQLMAGLESLSRMKIWGTNEMSFTSKLADELLGTHGNTRIECTWSMKDWYSSDPGLVALLRSKAFWGSECYRDFDKVEAAFGLAAIAAGRAPSNTGVAWVARELGDFQAPKGHRAPTASSLGILGEWNRECGVVYKTSGDWARPTPLVAAPPSLVESWLFENARALGLPGLNDYIMDMSNPSPLGFGSGLLRTSLADWRVVGVGFYPVVFRTMLGNYKLLATGDVALVASEVRKALCDGCVERDPLSPWPNPLATYGGFDFLCVMRNRALGSLHFVEVAFEEVVEGDALRELLRVYLPYQPGHDTDLASFIRTIPSSSVSANVKLKEYEAFPPLTIEFTPADAMNLIGGVAWDGQLDGRPLTRHEHGHPSYSVSHSWPAWDERGGGERSMSRVGAKCSPVTGLFRPG